MFKRVCGAPSLPRSGVLWIILGTAAIVSPATALSPDLLIKQITKNPANDYHLKWSPDGKVLAFASVRSGEPKIWLIPADGGEAALLETSLSGDHHISWAPDGKRMAFDARWNGRPNIFTISLADGKTKRLSPDGTVDFHPSWSPDGSRIAFASLRSGNADIWVMSAEGGQVAQLTHDKADDHHPVWSPDGSKIAFASDRSGNWDLWIIPASGGEAKQLTFHEADDDQASWAPDGARIAFMSKRSGKRDVWTVAATGGEPVRLTEEFDNGWPTWSPNGTRIAFSSNRAGNTDIWVKDVKEVFPVLKGPYLGRKPPGLTPEIFAPGVVSTGLSELNSVFSADGREFYFCVRNMGASSLFVMKSADGVWGRPEPLPFAGPYNDIDVSLSPDGRTLFFCSNRPVTGGGPPKEDHDIWMCERAGRSWGSPVHLGEAVNSPREDFYPIVTSSKTLYFNSQRAGPGTNDIYMCRWVDGRYAAAEKLGPEINSDAREFDAFVAPDESFMILTSERPGDDRFGDLYISFRTPEGGWTPARNMGKGVNGVGPEYGTTLSPDGRFLFFTRMTLPRVVRDPEKPLTYDDYLKMHASPDNGSTNIWWVDAEIIKDMIPDKTLGRGRSIAGWQH